MEEMFRQLKAQFAVYGPTLLAGLAVLVVGWLIALLAASVVRKLLHMTSVDNKIAQWVSDRDARPAVPVEQWVSRVVFYLIMLVVLIAFLATIQLTVVTEPLNSVLMPFLDYLPRLVGAAVLILVAWLLATIAKKVAAGACRAMKLDERLGGATTEDARPIPVSQTFPSVIYWLVFLIFVPLILQALDLQALLEPVTTLFNKVSAFLPNILSAIVILLVGWLVARIVQRIVQGLLVGVGVDRLSEKWRLAGSLGKQKLSGLLALIVYFVILVPVIISALAALQLDAITNPASDMLGQIMAALPRIFGALIVVLIALVVGRIVSGLVTSLLAGLGFNNIPVKLGLAKQTPQGKHTPAAIVGWLVLAYILLLAAVTAADMLEFQSVGILINEFIVLASHILLGLLIFALGLLLAQVVAKGILATESHNARRLALIARVVILVLAGAMALKQTGVADDIVNLAFGLTLGAVAVAAALAFGLGGRDAAARTLEQWRASEGQDRPKH